MKNKCILKVTILIIASLIAASCSRQENEENYEETQFKMDTAVTLKAYGTGSKEAVKAAFERISQIEQMASLQVNTSDVNAINNCAGKKYVIVHPEIIKILKDAVRFSKLSSGTFDVTIGPIINLWNIGTDKERIPSNEEIKGKLPLVGYEKIKINETNNSVMLEQPGMIIDLGGIAKGYAADEARVILENMGIKKAIINLGGSSICVIGSKGKNQPWKVGIQHPRKENGNEYLGIIALTDKSVSTSGDYERFFIKNGKRYHHILNPYNGYPADSGIISSTIICNNSMDADAMSTAVFILGPDKGIKLVESIPGTECIIVTSDKRILTSSGMRGKIESISEDFKYDTQGR